MPVPGKHAPKGTRMVWQLRAIPAVMPGSNVAWGLRWKPPHLCEGTPVISDSGFRPGAFDLARPWLLVRLEPVRVRRPRNIRGVIKRPRPRAGHDDVVDIERPPHGLIEVQLRFDQVDPVAQFDALGCG